MSALVVDDLRMNSARGARVHVCWFYFLSPAKELLPLFLSKTNTFIDNVV